MSNNSARILLVDYENIPHLERTQPDEYAKVLVLVGSNQHTLRLPTSGKLSNISLVRVAKPGNNSLDLHLAMYLGRLVERLKDRPGVVFEILSGDADFDPLVQHVNDLGRSCRRITLDKPRAQAKPQQPAKPRPAPVATQKQASAVKAEQPTSARLLFFTKVARGPARPSTRQALANHSYANKKSLKIKTIEEAYKIVEDWEKAGLVRFKNEKAQYVSA